MPKTITASERSALIRLASTMDVGTPHRKAILAGLVKTSRRKPHPTAPKRKGAKVLVVRPLRVTVSPNDRMTLNPRAKGVVSKVRWDSGSNTAILDHLGGYPDDWDYDGQYKYEVRFPASAFTGDVSRYSADEDFRTAFIPESAFIDGTVR